jgi:ADP-ribose pyrophosphatase YjhB (NUDIX family)
MAEGRIRVVALGIVVRPSDGRVLAMRFDRDVQDIVFYRPPGGGVEFGETAIDAVAREMLEEVGHPVRVVRLGSVTENIFDERGRTHHEIIFNWLVDFEEAHLYAQAEFDVVEDDGLRFVAHWVDPDALAAQGIYFFPPSTADFVRTLRT